MTAKQKASRILFVPLAIGIAMALSGCSLLSKFKIDEVSDNVDYRNNSGSVRDLALPPGLSTPVFDQTFKLARTVRPSDTPLGSEQPPVGGFQQGVLPTTATNATTSIQAVLTTLKDGYPALVVAGRYEQVWTKVGAVLESQSMAVLPQPEQGSYQVGAASEENGLVARVLGFFTSDDADSYRLVVKGVGQDSLIVVSDVAGKPLDKAGATLILERLRSGLVN